MFIINNISIPLSLLCAASASLCRAEPESKGTKELYLHYQEVNQIENVFGSAEARAAILMKTAPAAWIAAYAGSRAILCKLAECGDDFGEKSVEGDNVLWAACCQDDEEVIDYVWRKRPDLLEAEEGIPWLWAMVSYNRHHADLIDEMLKQREPIYGFSGVLESIWRDSPYMGMFAVTHYGKKAQDVAMAQWLMRRGAEWQTPEGRAQYENDRAYLANSKYEFASLIIGNAGDASRLKSEELRGLIRYAVGTVSELKEQFAAWHLPLERRLIYGRTPLIEALAIHRKDVAKALIDLGADVRARDANGRHVLFYSAMDESLIRQVLAMAPDLLNARDERGLTAAEHIVLKTPFPPHRDHQRSLRLLDTLLSFGAKLPEDILDKIWEKEDMPMAPHQEAMERIWSKVKKSEILERHGYHMKPEASERYQKGKTLYYSLLNQERE